jgi:hypothetical protein
MYLIRLGQKSGAPERRSGKQKPPSIGRENAAPERELKGKVPERGRSPPQAWVKRQSPPAWAKPPSVGRKAKPPSVGEAPERGSKGKAPKRGRSPRAWVKRQSPRAWAKPSSVGEAPERGSKGKAPERKHTQMSIHRVRNLNFIAWCRRHNVRRGLLPTPDYIVEGVGRQLC